MNSIHTLFKVLTLLLTLMVGSRGAMAQAEDPFIESFYFTQTDVNNSTFVNMNNLTRFTNKDWSFENCYGIRDTSTEENGMQVGSDSAEGYALSPGIGLTGNISLLVKVQNVYGVTSDNTFTIETIDGNRTISTTSCTVSGSEIMWPSAILIKECTPTTRIKIKSEAGHKFLVKTIKAFPIGNAVFYESFDYMEGTTEFGQGKVSSAQASMCDNYAMTNMSYCYQAKYNLFLSNPNTTQYSISRIPARAGSTMLLSFKVGHSNLTQSYSIRVSCTGAASLTEFGSDDISKTESTRETTIDNASSEWITYSLIVKNMSNNTKLTFTGSQVNIDDVLITPIGISLDQNLENSACIQENDGRECNVQLLRTLTQNVWCPLCLPFDVTAAQLRQVTNDDCQVQTLSSIVDGVFKFSDAAEAIPAGTPFIVKPTATVENPTFTDVTISNTPAKVITFADAAGYAFQGIYSPTDLTTDGTNLFLSTDGTLYRLSSDATDKRLGGLRAFFVVPADSNGARVTFSDGASAISTVSATRHDAPAPLYDLMGRRLSDSPVHKGLYLQGGKKHIVK